MSLFQVWQPRVFHCPEPTQGFTTASIVFDMREFRVCGRTPDFVSPTELAGEEQTHDCACEVRAPLLAGLELLRYRRIDRFALPLWNAQRLPIRPL